MDEEEEKIKKDGGLQRRAQTMAQETKHVPRVLSQACRLEDVVVFSALPS